MLPSTKRNLVLGVFLVIVTLVVLYSYCNGNSVCYTFPFFSGLDRDRLVKPEVVVTSVIVQTKRPFDIATIPRKYKGKHVETSVKQSEFHATDDQKVKQEKTVNFTGEVEKLHFDHNISSLKTYMFRPGEKNVNRTQAIETLAPKKHLLPPSDIVGKVAEEILRRANVSEEEANRELIRVEKVDETVDKEKKHQQEHALLQKVKESRAAGGKSSERKLVRVERVDLTDEEEDEGNEPEKPFHDFDFHARTKSNNMAVNSTAEGKESSRVKSGMDLKTEDLESVHARRFGRKNVLEDESRNLTNVNLRMETPKSTLPPFFAKFLNITAKERQMVDLLHNFTNNSKQLYEPKPSISPQGNKLDREKPKMTVSMETSSAHAEKTAIREKRSHNEAKLHDTLVDKLLNISSDGKSSLHQHNGFERFSGPLNLSGILETITERSQNLVNKDMQNSVPDSTALLVKFLKEGSRYRLRMPPNVTAAHTKKDKSRIAATNLGRHVTELQSSTEGAINLRKTLLDLANHIDLTRHSNRSKTELDQENKADLMMLKLLLHQSTLQDLSTFNLSRVLNEIAENSLKNSLTALQPAKVKRDTVEDNLRSTGAQSGVKIFRPVPDKLKTSTRVPVFNTETKTSSLLQGNGTPSSLHDSLSTTQNGIRSNIIHASFSSGSGSGDLSEDEKSTRSSEFEMRKNRDMSSKRKTSHSGRSKMVTNGILKFDTIRCEELDPKVLLYNRIFKTGSSTTESIITNSSSSMNYDYKIGTTEDWYDKGESRPYPGLIIRKANKKLIKHPRMAFVAHFYFRSNLNLPQAHTYINQVRNPIRRLVSHYHYMRSKNRPRHRIKEFLASGEKNETLEQCFKLQHKGCQNNVMTRFFCGRHRYCRRGNLRALHKARHNIKRYYATVGLLEHYEVYLQVLNKLFPKFFPQVSSDDIGKFKYNPKYNFDDVPEDLIGEITKANWADVKLYSFVKKRFWEQAKACGVN